MAWINIWAALLAVISSLPWVAEGVKLTPCPLVARENTQTVVTCSGINSTDTVYWDMLLVSNNTRIGNCTKYPASCYIQLPSVFGLSRTSTDVSTMTIMSATRATFSGAKITCETQSSNGTATGTDSCLVDVVYGPTLKSLTINNVQGNLTVKEGDVVNITCSATGRPTPAITLYSYWTRLEPFLRQGDVTEDQVVTFSHVQGAATCEMTGPYTCEVKNDPPVQTSRTAHLFVSCPPRKRDNTYPLETPTVNYVNTPQKVRFNLVAYPVPDNFTFSYMGPSRSSKSRTAGPVTSNNLQMTCITTDFLYNVICSVTVDSITSVSDVGLYGVGLYGVRVSNAIGYVDLEFIITINESATELQPDRRDLLQLILTAVGVCTGMVILVILIVMLIRQLRKRTGKETNIQLSNLRFENPSGSFNSATEQGTDSESMFSVRTWTPKNGGLTPMTWTTCPSSRDLRSDASDIYEAPDSVSSRIDDLTPTVPAVSTMGPALPPRSQTVMFLSHKTFEDAAFNLPIMTSRNVPIKMRSQSVPSTMTPENASTSMKPGNVPSTITSPRVPTEMKWQNVGERIVSTAMASCDNSSSPSFNSLTVLASMDSPMIGSSDVKESSLPSLPHPTRISFRGHRKPHHDSISQKVHNISPTFV